MTLAERLFVATEILIVLYAVAFGLCFLVRAVLLGFGRNLGSEKLPWYFAWGMIFYPAAVVYGFVLNQILGFVLITPFLIGLLIPEAFFVTWKSEPAVKLPETVTLSEPVRIIGNRYHTRVQIDGEAWTAEISDVDGLIPDIGATLRVIGRSGTKILLSTT